MRAFCCCAFAAHARTFCAFYTHTATTLYLPFAFCLCRAPHATRTPRAARARTARRARARFCTHRAHAAHVLPRAPRRAAAFTTARRAAGFGSAARRAAHRARAPRAGPAALPPPHRDGSSAHAHFTHYTLPHLPTPAFYLLPAVHRFYPRFRFILFVRSFLVPFYRLPQFPRACPPHARARPVTPVHSCPSSSSPRSVAFPSPFCPSPSSPVQFTGCWLLQFPAAFQFPSSHPGSLYFYTLLYLTVAFVAGSSFSTAYPTQVTTRLRSFAHAFYTHAHLRFCAAAHVFRAFTLLLRSAFAHACLPAVLPFVFPHAAPLPHARARTHGILPLPYRVYPHHHTVLYRTRLRFAPHRTRAFYPILHTPLPRTFTFTFAGVPLLYLCRHLPHVSFRSFPPRAPPPRRPPHLPAGCLPSSTLPGSRPVPVPARLPPAPTCRSYAPAAPTCTLPPVPAVPAAVPTCRPVRRHAFHAHTAHFTLRAFYFTLRHTFILFCLYLYLTPVRSVRVFGSPHICLLPTGSPGVFTRTFTFTFTVRFIPRFTPPYPGSPPHPTCSSFPTHLLPLPFTLFVRSGTLFRVLPTPPHLTDYLPVPGCGGCPSYAALPTYLPQPQFCSSVLPGCPSSFVRSPVACLTPAAQFVCLTCRFRAGSRSFCRSQHVPVFTPAVCFWLVGSVFKPVHSMVVVPVPQLLVPQLFPIVQFWFRFAPPRPSSVPSPRSPARTQYLPVPHHPVAVPSSSFCVRLLPLRLYLPQFPFVPQFPSSRVPIPSSPRPTYPTPFVFRFYRARSPIPHPVWFTHLTCPRSVPRFRPARLRYPVTQFVPSSPPHLPHPSCRVRFRARTFAFTYLPQPWLGSVAHVRVAFAAARARARAFAPATAPRATPHPHARARLRALPTPHLYPFGSQPFPHCRHRAVAAHAHAFARRGARVPTCVHRLPRTHRARVHHHHHRCMVFVYPFPHGSPSSPPTVLFPGFSLHTLCLYFTGSFAFLPLRARCLCRRVLARLLPRRAPRRFARAHARTRARSFALCARRVLSPRLPRRAFAARPPPFFAAAAALPLPGSAAEFALRAHVRAAAPPAPRRLLRAPATTLYRATPHAPCTRAAARARLPTPTRFYALRVLHTRAAHILARAHAHLPQHGAFARAPPRCRTLRPVRRRVPFAARRRRCAARSFLPARRFALCARFAAAPACLPAATLHTAPPFARFTALFCRARPRFAFCRICRVPRALRALYFTAHRAAFTV